MMGPMTECQQKMFKLGRCLVGDPVDVVTGANIDSTCDFELPGPIPLTWRRYYNSAQNKWLRALGWGHTHEYDRLLRFDLDGMRYTGPDGTDIEFPPLEFDGAAVSNGGFTLTRVNALIYDLRYQYTPITRFRFKNFDSPARITHLIQGDYKVIFTYDYDHHLVKIVDALGRVLRIEHDNDGRILAFILTNSTQGERALVTYQYDNAGNLTHGIDAYGQSFSFSYDNERRILSRTDRRGYSFFFEYDNRGYCTHSYGEDGLFEVQLIYEPASKQTIVTKADGGKWTYKYNVNGVITHVIDPYGGVRVFELDEAGRIEHEIDENKNVSQFTYDHAGAPTGKIDPLGRFFPLAEQPEYLEVPEEPLSRELREEDIPESPAQCEYDDALEWEYVSLPTPHSPSLEVLPDYAKGLIKTVPPDRNVILENMAALGAVWEKESAGGVKSVYDELGLLKKEIWPDGTSCRWTYDANGNSCRYIDREGFQYIYEWTSWNLLAKETDPLGHVVTYRYTPNAKVATIVDAGGTCTDYSYDRKDRVIGIHRYGGDREQYQYDIANNLIAKLDNEGRTLVSYEIGSVNLKTAEHLASGEHHSFDYDEKGRVIRATTDAFEVTFAYDEYGNRIQDQRNRRGITHKFDRGIVVKTTALDRFTTCYTYKEDGSILIQDPGGQCHTVHVMEDGLLYRTMSNGMSEVSQYDPDERCLLRVIVFKPYSKVRSIQYEYSSEGNLRKVKDSEFGTFQYGYDARHRLSNFRLPCGDVQHITYDSADNLLQKPGCTGVTLREGNRLATANGDRFEYDDQGRISLWQTPKGAYHYQYTKGLLTRISTPEGEWQARYDSFGRRISKSFGNEHVEFFWDNYRLAAEINQNGGVRIYLYPDEFALVPIIFIDYEGVDTDPASGRRFFIFYNQVSTPILVTDESGKSVWNAKFEPYGMADINHDDSFHMPLRFPGHYLDVETGLHYNRYRYYCPKVGRYIQPDPVGLEGGLNLYAYTRNPLLDIDVLGLGPCGRNRRPRRGSRAGKRRQATRARRGRKRQARRERQARRLIEQMRYEVLGRLRQARAEGRNPGAISVVRDRRTGRTWVAESGQPRPTRDQVHPRLRRNYPPGGRSRERWEVENCAEFKGVNNALQDGARINDLDVYTISGRGPQAGQPYPRCQNCQQTVRGPRVLSE